jgi:hypothetical protein
MVVVLLGCVGLTAGITLGTLFPSNEVRLPFGLLYSQKGCHSDWRLPSAAHRPPAKVRVHRWSSGGVAGPGPRAAHVRAPNRECPRLLPLIIRHSAPLPMGGYVLLGLLAGLSAALGFLVPPRSSLTRR